MLFQILLNSFALGSFYALIALGFALIFGVTHVFNLAHGELIIFSGYIAYILTKYYHIPFTWTLPVCMVSMMFLSALLRQLLCKVKEQYELNSLVITFGVAVVLQNLMVGAFTADYRIILDVSSPAWLDLTKLYITKSQGILIILSLMSTVALYFLWRKTFLGKALRATIQDREAARLAGINVDHMSLFAFMLGGLLIGLAGPLYAQTAYLHPFGGLEATLIAVIITIFAGIGRIRGILVGGWILGTTETLAAFALGGSWRELVSALILISLLVFRPEGVLSGSVRSAK